MVNRIKNLAPPPAYDETASKFYLDLLLMEGILVSLGLEETEEIISRRTKG